MLNHFLTNPIALPQHAQRVNANPFLEERVRRCEEAAGHLPNLVAVDFYSIGDVLEVVAGLNGS